MRIISTNLNQWLGNGIAQKFKASAKCMWN